jgi:hypothetical protein
MGSSPGFAPLSILSTREAAWRPISKLFGPYPARLPLVAQSELPNIVGRFFCRAILKADGNFKHHFSPNGTLSPARRIVNGVTIHANPAVFLRILPFAAADFPQSALWHERTPSLLIGSRQNPSALEYQAA